MAINERGLALVKYFEGLRLKAYKDPVGIWTIGYGHTGPDVHEGLEITEEQADQLLLEDLGESETYAGQVVKVPLTGDQVAAVVSFAFNAGNGSLKSSTLLKKLNAKDYSGAADEFPRWVYGTVNGKKVKLPGLVTRRDAERKLFLGLPFELGAKKLELSTGEGDAGAIPGIMGGANADDYDTAFSAHIQSLGLKYFKPYEFLVLGHQNSNPGSPAYGLNRKPPRDLWKNIDATARVIDRLREIMGAPIATQSVYRTSQYNQAIGGAGASQHMEFRAIDFVVKSNSSPSDWAAALRQMRQSDVFHGGIGTYSSFVHVDTRGVDADW